jgi:segregation and condensation protein A
VGGRLSSSPNEQQSISTETFRDDAYRIELPQFEGPLDLLLHLITKHELDIIDIPIGFITEKYLEYLSLMEELSIDIASEYLVMAATLAHIKSKMLLPTPPADQDDGLDDGPEDPRAELVRRLLEYQKYKAAALDLSDQSMFGQDVFGRAPLEEQPKGPAPLAQVSVFSLIDAFHRIVARRKIRVDHEVDLDRISITERITELMDALRQKGSCTLEALLPDHLEKSDIIITLLALLEMTRLRMTRLSQSEPLAPIHVALAVEDEEEQKSDIETDKGTHAPRTEA